MLPPESEILEARQCFDDAQAALDGAVIERIGPYTCDWIGTSVLRERGSFAVVNSDGPLTDLIGDRVKITYKNRRSVNVYVVGSARLDQDISLTRRAFLELALLASEFIEVKIEVLSA